MPIRRIRGIDAAALKALRARLAGRTEGLEDVAVHDAVVAVDGDMLVVGPAHAHQHDVTVRVAVIDRPQQPHLQVVAQGRNAILVTPPVIDNPAQAFGVGGSTDSASVTFSHGPGRLLAASRCPPTVGKLIQSSPAASKSLRAAVGQIRTLVYCCPRSAVARTADTRQYH